MRARAALLCAAIGAIVVALAACSNSSHRTIASNPVTYADACGAAAGCPSGQVPASLRRPLRLPPVSRGACPVTTPVHRVAPNYGNAVGTGPVYPIVADDTATVTFVYPPPPNSAYPSGFGGQKVLWVIAPSYTGPVLIRGRQLDGTTPLWFQLGGGQPALAEMQLPPSTTPGWRDWPSATLLTTTGCYAWQVDGASFTTVIVFRALRTQS